MAHTYLSLFSACYLLEVKPRTERGSNLLEGFNEVIIVAMSDVYLTFLVSEELISLDGKDYSGILFILLYTTLILVNMGLICRKLLLYMLPEFLRETIEKLKRWKLHRDLDKWLAQKKKQAMDNNTNQVIINGYLQSQQIAKHRKLKSDRFYLMKRFYREVEWLKEHDLPFMFMYEDYRGMLRDIQKLDMKETETNVVTEKDSIMDTIILGVFNMVNG